MKLVMVDAADEQSAQVKLAEDLGIGIADLKFIKAQQKKFSFEVLNCPAKLEVEISRDGMKAILKRLALPIGETAPRLDVNFVTDALNKLGVKMGIKRDVISAELLRIMKTPGYDDNAFLSIVVAEGVAPVGGSTGRPKWTIDLKQFEKNIPLYVRKGEVLARAPHAVAPKDGFRVTGEVIPALVEEQFKLNVGAGIKTAREASELVYVAQTFGKLFYDQGIRLRVESKVIDQDEGMAAAVEVPKQTVTGLSVRGEDLIEMAKEQRVTFGFLPAVEIDLQIKSEKKFPAIIRIAKGRLSVDGAHGEVKFPYRENKSTQLIDQQKSKLGIVFPGEVIAIISPAKEPIHGMTVFGETLRGKPCDDFPLYPGKNVNRDRAGADMVLKSTIYGKVKVDKDRILVENILKVSADKMEVTLDLFPQTLLGTQDILNLLREIDVLVSPEKQELEKSLKEAFDKAQRFENLVVAQGKSPKAGTDAKVVYRFNPEVFKVKAGLFQKKSGPLVLAVPGDLIMTKILPVEAQDGVNVFRDKIPVAQGSIPKDVQIKAGDGIDEKQLGREGDPQDPLRLEFRAAILGTLVWKDRVIDVSSTLEFDKKEMYANIALAPYSDFGTPINEDVLKKVAEAEGIKVDIDRSELKRVLAQKRNADGSLTVITFAKAVEPKNGTDSEVQYFVDYNEKPIGTFLGQRSGNTPSPAFTDCVRPKEILGVKKPATVGEDGKNIFGRRLPAERGKDEPWYIGEGVEKSPDGLQILCAAKGPSFAFVDAGRLIVKSTVKISADKMSATVSIYPTQNPRFPLREEKILAMLTEAGVKFGVKREIIRDAVVKANQLGEASIDILVAEGVKPIRGREGSYVLAIDVGNTVGEIRSDGSVDYRDRNVFLSVRKGQLLLIKRPPGAGEDGHNVLGDLLPSLFGVDAKMEAQQGVEVTANGLEYRALVDGIVEIKQKSVKVIAGLLIQQDVSYKTGHIEAGSTDLFIKGGVMPDFKVHSEGSINIEKVAEAATVLGGGNVRIRGGVIGKDRGYVHCGKDMDTIYISGGATVEVLGNLTVGTEVLGSNIRVGGMLTCSEGAGTIYGGEIWAFGGMKVKAIGAMGSETQTVIHLGESYFAQKAAEEKIKNEGLDVQIADLEEKIRVILRQVSEGFDSAEEDGVKGNELQQKYKLLIDEKQNLQRQLDHLKQMRQSILDAVPYNPNVSLIATDMIFPGVTIIHRNVVWVLKEPQRGVEVKWNSATSNLISKRI